MNKYECLVCGYIFDEEQVIINGRISISGTPVDDYLCPECGSEDLEEE